MQVRGIVLVTIILFLGIAALIFHLFAMCSPHWKITKRDLPPTMAPVSYGLWQRCEYTNYTIIKQGITIGPRANVQICWPNLYMRYAPEKFDLCYNVRRQCPIAETTKLPEGCSCHYLPSTKAVQYLAVIATIFLIFALLILYLKTIAAPQNESALYVLSYGPFICFLLAFLLMATGLILIGAYLRRDSYEDYSFPLTIETSNTPSTYSFDLHSLRNYATYRESTFSHENYAKALNELLSDANEHYHTTIGSATICEIIATILLVIITGLSFWLGRTSKLEDV